MVFSVKFGLAIVFDKLLIGGVITVID